MGSCSNEDKTKLTTNIADSLSRVVVRSHMKTEAQLLEEMATYQRVIDFYEGFIASNPQMKETYGKELARLKANVKLCKEQLLEVRTPMSPKKLDPKAEGSFEEVSVERSSNLMKASLRR